MEETKPTPQPTAKERLMEIAEKSQTSLEQIVKLVIQATSDDKKFAEQQIQAMKKLEELQRKQADLLEEQNRQMAARIDNYQLNEQINKIWPKETPKIEVQKPSLILP